VVKGTKTEFENWGFSLDAKDFRLAGPREIVALILDKVTSEPGCLIVLDSWDSIAKELDPVERLRTRRP